MRPIVKNSLLALLIITGSAWASVPPHPRLLEKIRSGEIAAPYYLRHMAELRAKGINAPWSAPALKNMPLDGIDGAQRRFGPAATPTGSYNALVILVDFSDNIQQVQATAFDTLIFGAGSGTMRDYFSVVSYGDLDVVTVNLPSAIGWARAPQAYSYYVGAAGQNGMGSYPTNSQGLVEAVVNLVNASVDFSLYDNDGDNYVDALFVVHSGPGAEYTGSDADIWSHAWATPSAILLDSVYVWRYSIEPEFWVAPGDMTIGVYAHEMGHAAFGLPDLYDYDYDSRGLGRWSLMAGGSWNGYVGPGGESPALPDAWSHIQMGYITPIVHMADTAGYTMAPVTSMAEVHRLWTDGTVGNEYFLVENRQQLSYDGALPSSGLVIYHVDDNVYGNDDQWYPGYTAYGHYQVALEQADGLWELEKYIDSGDSGDPYPGSTNNTSFNAGSTPNSDAYDGSGTLVAVTNISDGGFFVTADLAVTMGDPPAIVVTPDSLWADLVTGDSLEQTLTIDNTDGTGDLIWSINFEAIGGPAVTFTKENYADWTLEANQDRISDNVWITRANNSGIFNAATEPGYQGWDTSPAGTEWSYGNTADLVLADYEPWAWAVDTDPPGMVNQPMSLHLISDDLYFDITFHSWTSGGAGGGFSYTRTDLRPAWLKVSAGSGTVAAGASQNVTVTFLTDGIYGGEYDGAILVASNDPATPQVRVPVHMSLTGFPEFAASDTALGFDTLFVNQTVKETITFYNLGNDDLLLSNINADLPEFIPDTSAFLIAPGDSVQFGVTFAPTTTGAFAGDLSITTNDSDEGSVVIALTGVAVLPPVIAVSPDSLWATLTTVDTAMRTFTIDNTGSSDLYFEITAIRRDPIGAAPAGSGTRDGSYTVLFDPARFMAASSGGSPNASGEPNPITTVRSINKTAGGAGLNVLIAAADDATQLVYYLTLHPDIATVDYIDAGNATPSVATMQTYDVVITWPNWAYYDAVQVGDNLADYVDGGGRVIMGTWCWYTYGNSLGGRIMTTDYNPFTGTGDNHYSTSSLGWYDPNHPIMEGVTQVTGYFRDYLSLNAGATLVADWQDSELFVGVKDDKPVAYLNVGLGDDHSGWGSDDLATLVSNTVVSQGVSWLAVNPLSGSVAPGGSATLDVTIDPAGLYTGEYDAHIVVASNDPVTPERLVAAHLSFTGTPGIAILPDSLAFGAVFVGGDKTLEFELLNDGTDLLSVSGYTSSNDNFSSMYLFTPFVVPPGESIMVPVEYTPTAAGLDSGTITISSDATDEPTITLIVTGTGLDPPVMAVSPDLLAEALFTGDSSTQTLSISNTGQSDLVFSIDVIDSTGDGAMPPQHGRVTRVEEPKGERTAPSRAQANDPPAIDRTGGPDPFGYKFSDSNEAGGPFYDWIEIATPAGGNGVEITDLTGADDAYYWPLVLPFNFNFYGVDHTEIAIQTNGTISFEDTYISYSNDEIPTDYASVEAFIAHYWTDLYVPPGAIYYRIDPDRVIIEFYQNTFCCSGDIADAGTWQVILYSNGNIVFQYQDVEFGVYEDVSRPDGGSSLGSGDERTFDYGEYAVIGIQANDSTGLQYSAYEAVLDSGLAVQFTHPDALWLSVSPAGGVLPPDSTIALEVAFDAADLLGGQYEAQIVVHSNDPLAPEVRVPVSLAVTGAPSIVVADSLEFRNTFVGWGAALVLDIFNVGTDLLTVSNITSDNGAFTVDSTAFSIPPREKRSVMVTFMPSAAGGFAGELIITSNDPNDPTMPVILLGTAIDPPVIALGATEFTATLAVSDSVDQVLRIDNNAGGSDLNFSILFSMNPDVPMAPGLMGGAGSTGDGRIPGSKISASSGPTGERPRSTDQVDHIGLSPPGQFTAVTDSSILVIQDEDAWGLYMDAYLATYFGLAPVVITSSDIPSTDFTQYALIITTGDQSSTYYSNVSASVSQFEDYVAQGGIVQYQLATQGPDVTVVGGVSVLYGPLEYYNIILEPDHPLAAGLPDTLVGNYANHNWLSNLPPEAIIITETQDTQHPTTAEYSYGGGLVIATGMTWEYLYINEYESGLMMYNAVAYSLSVAGGRWLSADIMAGVVPAGGGMDITLTFNSTGLDWGRYEANLLLASNDPARPVELLPISLSVTPIGAPGITAITDEPGDQGGILNLAFAASADDIAGGSYPIEYYLVWRPEPDQPLTTGGMDGFGGLVSPGQPQTAGWGRADSVIANMSASYLAQVTTEIDSNHTGIHLVSLMVSAHTGIDSIPAAISTVARGYSVDNLPPATPLGIYATSPDSTFNVSWVYDITAEGDFQHFEVFRSNQQDFEPAPGDTALRVTTETTIIDQEGLDNSLYYYYRVAAVDTNNNRALSGVSDGVILEILAALGIPKEFALRQNYPNPFNPSTTLRFETPRQGRVELIVYDLRGREVVRLLDRDMPPGYFDVIWNGRTATGAPVASGMYFTRMVAPGYSRTIKMVLLK